MKCTSEKCENPAVFTVFWPGKEHTFCVDCTLRARNVATAMGFDLSYRLLPTESHMPGEDASESEEPKP